MDDFDQAAPCESSQNRELRNSRHAAIAAAERAIDRSLVAPGRQAEAGPPPSSLERSGGLTYLSGMRNVAFEPCLPSRGTKVPTSPDWIHEIKHDGYRLIVHREGSRVRLFTKTVTSGPTVIRGLLKPHCGTGRPRS